MFFFVFFSFFHFAIFVLFSSFLEGFSQDSPTNARLKFSDHHVPAARSGGAVGVHKRPTEPKHVLVKGPGLQKHHQYFKRSAPDRGILKKKKRNVGMSGEGVSDTNWSNTRVHGRSCTQGSGTGAPGSRTGDLALGSPAQRRSWPCFLEFSPTPQWCRLPVVNAPSEPLVVDCRPIHCTRASAFRRFRFVTQANGHTVTLVFRKNSMLTRRPSSDQAQLRELPRTLSTRCFRAGAGCCHSTNSLGPPCC